MINIAFLLNFPKEYKGGINYIKNLLYASSIEKPENFKYFLFVSSDIEPEYLDSFSPYAEIIKTDILKKGSLPWAFEKVLEKKFRINFLLLKLLKKHNIDIVSHSVFFSRYKKLKIISWIPDLQIIHYPELWSEKDRKQILNNYNKIIHCSDLIILSSNEAFKDFRTFTSENADKVRVLQFVSQPGSLTEIEFREVEKSFIGKYNIDRSFFYLPNQFWRHKNHMVVFKAVNLLKKRGLNPLLVTTGLMADYRGDNNYVNNLKNYIIENNLSENILLLGLIPYQEVLVLIRTCVTLINPSLFEGWSSTVEESKSNGKQILLSDIAIHREQDPENGIYFNPFDENELANDMENILNNTKISNSDYFFINQEVRDDLILRTKLFAKKYHDIIQEITESQELN